MMILWICVGGVFCKCDCRWVRKSVKGFEGGEGEKSNVGGLWVWMKNRFDGEGRTRRLLRSKS